MQSIDYQYLRPKKAECLKKWVDADIEVRETPSLWQGKNATILPLRRDPSFGLLFGALCIPVDWLAGGWASAAAWWVSGIPWDLTHCAGNFVLTLVLFKPLRTVFSRLQTQFQG